MLTWEDDVEVHALRKRGWSISAIARHTGHDRKTVRKYLAGEQTPGVRARPVAGSVRPVRRLRVGTVGRGPAFVGPHPPRRVGGSRVRAVVSEPDPQHPRPRIYGRRVRRAGRPPNDRTRSSPTTLVTKPNGIGWNCRTHPNPGGGAGPRTCWSDRWPVRGSGGRRCRRRRINRIWWPVWTGWSAVTAG